MNISGQLHRALLVLILLGTLPNKLLSMGPCFSNLDVTSLEVCEMGVTNDLVVDGQIINECCQGSRVGPPGPVGPQGPQGQSGSDAVSQNSLYALANNVENYSLLFTGQSDTVPLEIVFTDGWSTIVGPSGVSFECPADGLYQISYELFPSLVILTTTSSSIYNVSSWVELFSGSSSVEIEGSRVQIIKKYISVAPFSSLNTQLSNVFFVQLLDGDVIQLWLENRNFGGGLRAVTLSPTGTAANLTVTKIV